MPQLLHQDIGMSLISHLVDQASIQLTSGKFKEVFQSIIKTLVDEALVEKEAPVKYMARKETSALLGVHERTLINWEEKKLLTAYRPNGKGSRVFYHTDEVNLCIERGRGHV